VPGGELRLIGVARVTPNEMSWGSPAAKPRLAALSATVWRQERTRLQRFRRQRLDSDGTRGLYATAVIGFASAERAPTALSSAPTSPAMTKPRRVWLTVKAGGLPTASRDTEISVLELKRTVLRVPPNAYQTRMRERLA
jgi:hypothetical protein